MPGHGPPPGAHLTYSRQYRRCAKPGCPSCGVGGPGHGPYWYAYWREGGRQRSRYLGKNPPPEAALEAQLDAPALPEAGARAAMAPSAGAALRVRTLGGLAACHGAVDLGVATWHPRTAAALLACLLCAPGQRLRREELAELLWPGGEDGSGRRNLRVAAHHLRRLLDVGAAGQSHLRQEGEYLCLVLAPAGRPAGDWLDADAFERAAAAALAGRDAALCRAALALYTGEYLPEYPTEEWTLARREALRERYLALLLHLAALAERDGVEDEASKCLERVLAVDPCRESAARALMRLAAAAGRHDEAVRIYRRLAAAMRRELDLSPDRETEAQYQLALAGRLQASRARGNLPSHSTSFIGREAELSMLAGMLASEPRSEGAGGRPMGPRLVTLVGPGGCGKSRLACELARTQSEHFADGVWLIELAALPPGDAADPTPVARQACAALELREEAERDALAVLATHLAPRRALLILDNCEHLLPSSAAVVTTLLDRCPDVRMLATSRESLAVAGEQVWWLAPLETPDGRQAEMPLRELIGHAAVRLFVERGRAVRPGFVLTEGNREAVAAICARLDGMPLAIELAATRLGTLSPQDLCTRLDDRFRLLSVGNRAALPRHQTLRAVLDWSYDLLGEGERRLLRALSMFAGGWTLEAAEAVCGDGDTLDLLAGLVAKSLVQAQDTDDGAMRYELHETVREYALQRVRAAGEERQLRQRHLSWCLWLAEEAVPALAGSDPGAWLARLAREHDNLRAALGWCLGDEDGVTPGLRLAGALWNFWKIRGHWSEGRQWLAAVLARDGGDPHARIPALKGLARLAEEQWDLAEARAAQEQRLALARAVADDDAIQTALLGVAAVLMEDPAEQARAAAMAEAGLALARRDGRTRNLADALTTLAMLAGRQSDHARSIVLLEESLAHYRAVGDRIWVAHTQFNLAFCLRKVGRFQDACDLLAPLLPLYEELGDVNGVAAAHGQLGRLAFERGDHEDAISHLRITLRTLWDLGNRGALVDALEDIAAVAAGCGQPAACVRLLGAAEALLTTIGLPPDDHQTIVPNLPQVHHLLGDRGFAAAMAAGRAMPIEQAVDEAMTLCETLSAEQATDEQAFAASS